MHPWWSWYQNGSPVPLLENHHSSLPKKSQSHSKGPLLTPPLPSHLCFLPPSSSTSGSHSSTPAGHLQALGTVNRGFFRHSRGSERPTSSLTLHSVSGRAEARTQLQSWTPPGKDIEQRNEGGLLLASGAKARVQKLGHVHHATAHRPCPCPRPLTL